MLFKQMKINSLLLPNRIIRSATWDGMATKDGDCTDNMVRLFEKLVRGGVGLCMTGFACVHRSGKAFPYMPDFTSHNFVNSFSKLTDHVHKLNGKIGIQLSHGGAYSRPNLISGNKILVPSFPDSVKRKDLYKQMDHIDIHEQINAFRVAALKAKEAGFDLIQIQAGHGYLIHQFLSSLTNKRKDKYGGSLINRNRFLIEVFRHIRDAVGDKFPVIIKINVTDLIDNGITIEKSIKIIRQLYSSGIDAVEISGGSQEDTENSPIKKNISSLEEGYFLKYAKIIKNYINELPVIAVGGIRSIKMAQEVLSSNTADFIALSRPLICEPDLALKWYQGKSTKSRCISCNKCFMPGLYGRGVQCILNQGGDDNNGKYT